MPGKFKCDKCEETFSEPIERQHEEIVPDYQKIFSEMMPSGTVISGSGSWFPPGKREWTTRHCPFCDSQYFSEWFEGYINWEDYF